MNLRLFVRPIANSVRRMMIRSLGKGPVWRRVPCFERLFWMRIDRNQVMDLGYYFGSYEPALTRVIDLLVGPGEAAIDIERTKAM